MKIRYNGNMEKGFSKGSLMRKVERERGRSDHSALQAEPVAKDPFKG